jgi:hypothetical protein
MKEATNARMVFNAALVQQISEINKIITRICQINLAKYSCIRVIQQHIICQSRINKVLITPENIQPRLTKPISESFYPDFLKIIFF